MEYRILEWVQSSPKFLRANQFITVPEITPAIKQAIVNDIRENGYILSNEYYLSPLLNTGEIVNVDEELAAELVCRAYGFDRDRYNEYLTYARKEPLPNFSGRLEFDYPIKQVLWVKSSGFDELKRDLLSGKSNVEIIPSCEIAMKKGDVMRITNEDGTDFFEIGIKEHVCGILSEISDFTRMENTDTESLLNLILPFKKYVPSEPVKYRFECLPGEEIGVLFEKFYGLWELHMIAKYDFDCAVDAVVFDTEPKFERTVLDSPKDIPLESSVAAEIEARYLKGKKAEKKR